MATLNQRLWDHGSVRFGAAVLLFVLLWLFARKQRKPGEVAAAFLLGYGAFRFIAEFFREPDAHLGLLALGLSMGQWLCVPMVALGAWMWLKFVLQNGETPSTHE